MTASDVSLASGVASHKSTAYNLSPTNPKRSRHLHLAIATDTIMNLDLQDAGCSESESIKSAFAAGSSKSEIVFSTFPVEYKMWISSRTNLVVQHSQKCILWVDKLGNG
jgi:hypothetical protein